MIRVIQKCALLAALASAGVAWGQSPPASTGAATPAGRVVTLRETGGLPEACRVLRTWTTPSGEKVYLLQTLGAEEKITVVQTTAARPAATEVGAKIYRWGNEALPPKGSPAPPPDATDVAILPVAHATTLPDLQPTPAVVPARASAPAAAPSTAAKTVGRETDKPRAEPVRAPAKPVAQKAPAGDNPTERSPGYGYYPTQWHQWPGGTEPPTAR